MDILKGKMIIHEEVVSPSNHTTHIHPTSSPCILSFGIRSVYLEIKGNRISGILHSEGHWIFKTKGTDLGLTNNLNITIQMHSLDNKLFIGMYKSDPDLSRYTYQGMFRIEIWE